MEISIEFRNSSPIIRPTIFEKARFILRPTNPLPMTDSTPVTRSESSLGSGALEVQRVRVELLNQIQELQSVQESQLKDLDSRLSELQRDLKPRLHELESRNATSQSQLEETRKKVQSLTNTELPLFRRQYDELLMKFERFATVDVQSQLKPVQDDFRQSKVKLDELSVSTSSSIKRLSDQVKALNDSLVATAAQAGDEQSKCATELDKMEPKLLALEHQLAQLREFLSDAPAASGSANLVGEIDRIEKTIVRIQNDVLPEKVAEAQAPFNTALDQLQQYSEEEISKLQELLGRLAESHTQIDARRQAADESLSADENKAMEVEQKFVKLSDSTRTRLNKLEQKMKSTIEALKSEIAGFAGEGELSASQFEGTVSDDIGSLQKQILDSIRALREVIREQTEKNVQGQEASLKRIEALQDQLEGRGNVVGRVKDLEKQVVDLVNGVHEWEERRASRGKIGATPENVAVRLARIEERIAAAEARLQKIDHKQGIKAASYSTTPENIPPIPPLAGEAEADQQPPPPT
jgi:DNA repair exonuclease SbcCD ATPase subunit